MIEALLNAFLFHPAKASALWDPPPPGLAVRDVEFLLPDGTRIHAWWATPPDWSPERGAVLYCHGNAGNVSSRGESLRRWRDALQQAVLLFDYPGYGKSTGKPSVNGCHAAAQAAYDYLNQVERVPAESIILYGGSLGGGVAVALAAQRPHRALVLVATFTSLRDMGRLVTGGLRIGGWLAGDGLDSLALIGTAARPVFIAHGSADRVVPYEQGQRLYAAAGQPKQFFRLEGHDHNHTPNPEFYQALRRFLTEHAPVGGIKS